MDVRRQELCRCCGKVTLHERDPDPVNHILHLLLSLFCCGFWIPIWILLTLTATSRQIRCLTCGHALGSLTAIDQQAAARQNAKYAAQRQVARDQAVEATGKAAANAAKATGNVLLSGLVAVRTGILAVWLLALTALQQVDRVIWSMAGDDVFMVWFVRCLLVLAMLFVGSLVLYALFQLIMATK